MVQRGDPAGPAAARRALRGPNATHRRAGGPDAFKVGNPMYVAAGTWESNAWRSEPDVTMRQRLRGNPTRSQHIDFKRYITMTTVVRTAAYTSPGAPTESSPGNYLARAGQPRPDPRQFKTTRVHSCGGTQASLLAYFAPIANVRLVVLSAFMHCGSSAEPKAIR
jgi:hypothetical protein